MEKSNVNCNVCHQTLECDDMIFMDEINTLAHQKCYSLETNLPIKDLGTFSSIIEKYEFFNELIK